MNERKRLIELLNKSCEAGGLLMNDTRTTADYLLENGVVVLPCKVGDTVGIISLEVNRNTGDLERKIHSRRISKIELCRYGQTYLTDKGDVISEHRLGEDVFFTKEEAEQALKGAH